MRRLLVAGNWKLNGSINMTSELISGIAKSVGDQSLPYDILVCPPAPYLMAAKAESEKHHDIIAIGAQNVSPHANGAYTGEVSLGMLSEVGCRYVLLGHSERREYYGETDQDIAEKFAACIEADSAIIPVLCVGESLQQREAGETESVIARQVNAVIDKVGIEGFKSAVIAYEPVWAIGTGKTATPEIAQSAHAFIRSLLSAKDVQIADNIQLLYGGSVKASNAAELFVQEDIDGGLIGGASLQVESFAGICSAAQELADV